MENTTIGHQLAKILNLKRKFIDSEMNKLGISRTSWQVLCWMNTLGSCSQKELLKNLDIDAGHLARVLESLEKDNYISRRQIEGNRRSLFVELTDFGKNHIMPHLKSTLIKESSILLAGLDQTEVSQLLKLLSQLEANMYLAVQEIKENFKIKGTENE